MTTSRTAFVLRYAAALTLTLTSLAVLSACTEDEGDESVTTEVEDLVSVEQGIYGQSLTWFDTAEAKNPYRYREGDGILLYFSGDREDLLAETTTGRRGFFELAAEPGDYSLCLEYEGSTQTECAEVTVLDGMTRCNFSVGPDGEWNCPVE